MAKAALMISNPKNSRVFSMYGFVARITAEEFVASVARQGDLDMLTRNLRNQVRGNGGALPKWLIEKPAQLW